MRPLRTRGESGEDVRKRIERWKESVERAQSITVNDQGNSGRQKWPPTEEDILKEDGLLREA
jgi:hypothetical protein